MSNRGRWIWVRAGITGVVAIWLWSVHTLGTDRLPPSHDEAIYLSQVVRGVHPSFFEQTRSPGLVWLLRALPGGTQGSIEQIRLWIMVVNGTLLAATMAVWSRHLSWGFLIGGGMFASSWVTTFYGALIFPNLPSALLAATMVGSWLLPGRAAVLALPPLALIAGAMRPLDALTAIFACTLASGGVRAIKLNTVRSISLACASLAVIVPFAIDSAKYGGIFQRLADAQAIVPTGPRLNVGAYLSLLDGPLQFPDPARHLALRGAAWAFTILACLALAFLLRLGQRADDRRLKVVAFAVTAAAATAAPYWFFVGEGNSVSIRFLLPAFALGCMAFGGAVRSIVHSRVSTIAGTIGAALLVVAAGAAERPTAVGMRALQASVVIELDALGETIADRLDQRKCAILTPFGEANLALRTGCDVFRWYAIEGELRALTPVEMNALDEAATRWVLDRRQRGDRVIVLAGQRQERTDPFGAWHLARYRGARGIYYVYDPPEERFPQRPGEIEPLPRE